MHNVSDCRSRKQFFTLFCATKPPWTHGAILMLHAMLQRVSGLKHPCAQYMLGLMLVLINKINKPGLTPCNSLMFIVKSGTFDMLLKCLA